MTIAATIAAIGHTRGATAHRRGTATPRDAEARWTSSAGRSVASRFRISKDAATTNEKAAGSARARGAAAAARAHPRSAGHRSTRIRPREAGEASALHVIVFDELDAFTRERGSLFVFKGGRLPSGLVTDLASEAAWHGHGTSRGSRFGFAVASLGRGTMAAGSPMANGAAGEAAGRVAVARMAP